MEENPNHTSILETAERIEELSLAIQIHVIVKVWITIACTQTKDTQIEHASER